MELTVQLETLDRKVLPVLLDLKDCKDCKDLPEQRVHPEPQAQLALKGPQDQLSHFLW